MRAVGIEKPVNVFARYVTEWVASHGGTEEPPFDSFEALSGARVEQKDVERWLLNCNYAYFRLGDLLFSRDLLPDDATGLADALALLDVHLKSIRDSNPLKLRSREPEAIVAELAKDWPPFVRGSRGTLRRLHDALEALEASPLGARPGVREALRDFSSRMGREAEWYGRLAAGRKGMGVAAVAAVARRLLPVWCLVGANPLYTLGMWHDADAVDELAGLLEESFRVNGMGMPGSGAHGAFRSATLASQEAYLAALASADGRGEALAKRPVPEVARVLEREFFSLDRPCVSRDVPAWLQPKAQLVWNVALCSVLGPGEAVRTLRVAPTATSLAPHVTAGARAALRGEVLLRRRHPDGTSETIASLSLGEGTPEGLWRVLGSSLDPNAKVPKTRYRDRYDALGEAFVATAAYDRRGNLAEGAGDSRYHAEIAVEGTAGGPRLVLRDLGSKNGTYVSRTEAGRRRVIAMPCRTLATAADWAGALGVDEGEVTLSGTVELRRGDVIHLCGSSFEVI